MILAVKAPTDELCTLHLQDFDTLLQVLHDNIGTSTIALLSAWLATLPRETLTTMNNAVAAVTPNPIVHRKVYGRSQMIRFESFLDRRA